jgi:hypothetical protein
MNVNAINIAFGIPPERPTPEFAAKLESGADRSAPSRLLRRQGRPPSLGHCARASPYWAKDIKIGFEGTTPL